jgi:adenylate kinase family enzyme
MKIFVLGRSGACKTPFADAIASRLGMKRISASDWLKPLSEGISILTKQEHIDKLTNLALRELVKNPNATVESIRDNNDLTQPVIIEGLRSPTDFYQLVDLRHDMVVFLNRESNPYQTNAYESGLVVIDKYLKWAERIGLVDKERRVSYVFKVEEFDEVVENFVKFFQYRGWCVKCGDRGCLHQRSNS